MSSLFDSCCAYGRLFEEEKSVNDINLHEQDVNEQAFKLFVAIDFGTDGVALAYAYNNEIFVHPSWNAPQFGSMAKMKTIILFDENNECQTMGIGAKTIYMSIKSAKKHTWKLFCRFKMALADHASVKTKKKNIDINNELKAVNGCKMSSEKVFVAAFKFLRRECRSWIQSKQLIIENEEIQWIITVPALWNDAAKEKMKIWAIKAGLVDENIQNQCKIVYEPECASLAMQHYVQEKHNNTNIEQNDEKEASITLKKGDKYLLIDAGGGTVDIACHQIISTFGVKQILPPSGGKWGSTYIDDQYIQLLYKIFGRDNMDEFYGAQPNVWLKMIHNFQTTKALFYSDPEDEAYDVKLHREFFAFLDDKFNGIENIENKIDEMIILGKSQLVRLDGEEQILELDTIIFKDLFDQVINPIINRVNQLLNKSQMDNCKYLCLVGGLSCSPYFQHRMKMEFGAKSQHKLEMIIPDKPILSVVKGAAYFGITKDYIRARILNRTYGIKMDISVEAAKKLNIPEDIIHERAFYNASKKKTLVPNYFHVLARKNEEILTNKVKNAVCNRHYHQKRIRLSMYCSDKEYPLFTDTETLLSTIDIYFEDDNDELQLNAEFHFYDTMIRVYAYPTGQRDKNVVSILDYHNDCNTEDDTQCQFNENKHIEQCNKSKTSRVTTENLYCSNMYRSFTLNSSLWFHPA